MKTALAALALVLQAAPPDEKILLKFQPRKGDRISSTQKSSLRIELSVSTGGEPRRLTAEKRESQEATLEILEVEGNRITKALVDCREDVEEDRTIGQEEVTRREKPLHGRKVTLQEKDGRISCHPDEGIDEKTRASLRLEDSFAKTFPDRPVAVGERWETSGDALKTLFREPGMEGKLSARLAEVKDFKGRRSAFLEVEMDLKGPGENGGTFAVHLAGTLVVWIERGYTLQARLEGTMSLQIKNDQAEMSGRGPLTIEMNASVQ